MKFVKDGKECDCPYCDPYFGCCGAGSLIDELGFGDHYFSADNDIKKYLFSFEGKENIPEFPYQIGTVINDDVFSKIHEWETESRSLCTIHPDVFLLIALIKMHPDFYIKKEKE